MLHIQPSCHCRSDFSRDFVEETYPCHVKLAKLHSYITDGLIEIIPIFDAHDRLVYLAQRGV